MRADELVQFEMERFGVAVLRVLNQENNQESDDGGAGIDDQLPGVRKMEEGPAYCPNHQNNHGEQEHVRVPNKLSRTAGKAAEPQAHGIGFGHLLARLVKRR